MLTIVTSSEVPQSEFNLQFVQGMADRMATSYFKYGVVAAAYPAKVDALASLKLRLKRYEQTGNLEDLMDVANYAMIEFMRPRHPDAHFNPEDKSPGRVWNTGATTEQANTDQREANRTGTVPIQVRRPPNSFYSHEGD